KNTNDGVRRTLAEQIDRLDSVLDSLADGLNEAVATAVKEAVGVAVREAIQAVLTEGLTNPALLAKLGRRAPAAPPVSETPKPGLLAGVRRVWGWVGRQLRTVCQAGGGLVGRGCRACGTLFQRARQIVASFWARVQVVRHFKVQLFTALA